jgi:hypothetical protein
VEDWSYYSFRCGTCRDEIRKPAAPQVVALLTSGGVRVEAWSVPAEALEEHSGGPITHDEVLDMALMLQRIDNVAAVASAGARYQRPVA